jgi:hypothetical protein
VYLPRETDENDGNPYEGSYCLAETLNKTGQQTTRVDVFQCA